MIRARAANLGMVGLVAIAAAGCLSVPPAPHRSRAWKEIETNSPPGSLIGMRMVYDPDRRVTLLYGGYDGQILSDMWAWDGNGWTMVCSDCPPGQRAYGGFVYDTHRKVAMLYGGIDGTKTDVNDDMWEWNGTSWAKRSANGDSPGGRSNFFMGYDPVRQRTVLYGGKTAAGSTSGDLFEYDGETATWKKITAATQGPGPLQDNSGSLPFDSRAEQLILFDGTEMWGWNGTGWTERCQACTATSRDDVSTAWDPILNRILLIGGYLGGGASVTGTLEFQDGGAACQNVLPTARDSAAVVYDADRQVFVLFGGNGPGCNNRNCSDTMEMSLVDMPGFCAPLTTP